MLKYLLPVSVVLGIALVCSSGCKTEPKNPAARPPTAELKPDVGPRLNASTYFAHGHLLERQGNYQGAAEQYQRALALSPQMSTARNRLGITLNKLGRHAEATAQFRLAIEQNPADAYLQNNLGFSLYLEGKHAEALAALSAALELQPDYARAHMNRGIILAKKGDYPAALTEFTLTAGEADAHYNLGVIQSEIGDYAAAARSLENALTLNPDFDAARQQLHVVARLAAGVSAPEAEATAVVAAADDLEMAAAAEPVQEHAAEQSPTSAEPAQPLQSTEIPQELAADTTAPVPAVAAPVASQDDEEENETPNLAQQNPSGKHARQTALTRTHSHRRPIKHANATGQFPQKPLSAERKAEQDLKTEILRRIVMAKLGQPSEQEP